MRNLFGVRFLKMQKLSVWELEKYFTYNHTLKIDVDYL